MIAESVAWIREQGRTVVYDAEHYFDGYKADREYALDTLRANFGFGAAGEPRGVKRAGTSSKPGVRLATAAANRAGSILPRTTSPSVTVGRSPPSP